MADTPTFLLETDDAAPIGAAGGGIGAALAALALLFGLFAAIPPPAAVGAIPCPICTTPSPTICTTPIPCSPTPECPPGFMRLSTGGMNVPNKCYFFSKVMQSFFSNQILCNSLGGNLANPATIPEATALTTFLMNTDAGMDYYIGYTDFFAADPIRGTAGGPNPIPVLGVPPVTAGRDCTILKVVAGLPQLGRTDCTNAMQKNGICEVDLSKQTCVCP